MVQAFDRLWRPDKL